MTKNYDQLYIKLCLPNLSYEFSDKFVRIDNRYIKERRIVIAQPV